MKHRRLKLGVPKRKLFIIISTILVLSGIAAYGIARHANTTSKTNGTINYSPSSPADNKTIEERKNQPLPSTSAVTSNVSQSAPIQSSMVVKITGANVQSSNVHIGTLLSGTTGGTCVLTATQTGQNNLQLGMSNVRLDVNTYDCGVFNVPTTTFTKSGIWHLALTVTNGSDKVTDTYDVTIP